ncbi:branched-chain amino acid ABC transporter permease [Eoetvoesiella caeni]|uniref:Amino acid/amide ABC transporter membrane protein 1 (HAAT family) n=1 Tax=Eoetvoesiella caeni TaxID=645616 RepID=A0A366HGW2_9BURK|nr:branched-chain amino acid ABC transporter permease [Eoetvoesiella caeni]MCI2807986.1 branched-chain amino acid ABC transporter permease [Eoetvoesiella caeni]NYT54011.1 branched-chain amino acid ABC transporter permease [Eoetvoesiella caeni]RBP41905.1 amino acid/amide ABC transporter membrane protein 1 (HAAT family) [Eoetvoesiella caeni]
MYMLVEQAMNGLQYSALLFLLSAGLTLIFGIMNVVNLAHGSFYMVGAFCAAAAVAATGSFLVAILAALVGAALYGFIVERLIISRLYHRDHLDQVLATLGILLFTNALVTVVFGRSPPFVAIPPLLSGSVPILPGLNYPIMRLAFIAAGVFVAIGLWLLISRTKVGMLVRAGADDSETVEALGVNIRRLFMLVFTLGALLCGFAGVMAAPLLAVEIGMGEKVLITTFVVIVVGGVGSVRGALLGSLLVGMTDSFGRAYIPIWMSQLLPPQYSDSISSSLVSASIYILMAVVLLVKPRGLIPAQR